MYLQSKRYFAKHINTNKALFIFILFYFAFQTVSYNSMSSISSR